MVRPLHPKERQLYSRRVFLQRAAAAGIALPSLAAILAACGSGAQSSVATSASSGGAGAFGTGGISGAAYPLARPDAPVTWNVDEADLIASDLQPEQNATVKLLRWPYYLAPSVVKSFEKKYECTVEQTEFSDMDKGLAKIQSGQGDFDLLVGMNVWALGRSIASKLVRPLNLDYIPNLANNWDTFQSPFYDVGSHYSTPYSVWSTGIFWNNAEVTDDIAGMANPYDIFWDGAPVDKTHLLANAQDVLSMSMFRDGLTDVNVTDAATITTAKEAIAEVVHATNAVFDHVDYTDIPKGQAYLHQSWSGNVSDAFVFADPNDPILDKLSYLWPVESGVPGNVDNDLLIVLNSGKNPVLSHLLLNHIMDATNAMTNFTSWTGYQMPQKTMTRDALVATGVVPEHLANVYIEEADMDRGSRELELPATADALWQAAFAELQAGV